MPTGDTGDATLANPYWVGKFEATPGAGVTLDNVAVMLSNDQTVQFLGDASGVTAGVPLATLPAECVPDTPVLLPVVTDSSGGESQATFTVPEQSLTAEVDIPAQTIEIGTASRTAGLVSVDLDTDGIVTGAIAITPITNNPGPVTAEVPAMTGTTSVTIPEQTGQVSVPASKIGVLTIGTDGSVTCDTSGTVHLNGISFHICSNYY